MVFTTTIKWNDEVDTIRTMGLLGNTVKQIGEHYGVSKQRMSNIIKQKNIFSSSDTWGIAVKTKAKKDAHFSKWGNKTKTDLYNTCRERFRKKKYNAEKQGIEFTVKFSELVFPQHCPILGIELDYLSLDGRQENTPSFDRKDPSKGYVSGNVFVVSWRANRIKNDGTAEEHRRISEWMQ